MLTQYDGIQQDVPMALAMAPASSTRDYEERLARLNGLPVQALAYKIGELKFKELRAYAQKELGPAFDIRAFHDEVLRFGALPLDLLEQNVKAWIVMGLKILPRTGLDL